ncbi:MAG: hypothetical protein OEZ04_08460 [Nitrospinota bacterium]|nr:hypothetical protein [Nitrospinota bacterium]
MTRTKSKLLMFAATLFLLFTATVKFQACGNQQEAPPDPVQGLVALAMDGQVLITWNQAKNAASYNLYWDTEAGVSVARENLRAGTKVTTLKSTAFMHTGLSNGITYYYIVTGVTEKGTEGAAPQTEVSATPQSTIKCPSSQSLCQDRCVDLQTNDYNCGSCGNACPTGESCWAGICGNSCAAGRTLCNGVCVDVQTDAQNCGACGTTCVAPTNSCVSGSCV